MSISKKTEQLKEVRNEVLELEASPLHTYRTENDYLPVIGEGDHDADILFIGEAPGQTEAETGRPFCGRAGKMLDELLEHINLDRDSVYITNILKDRPPNNRDPREEEIEIYTPFLKRQIEIIQPRVIATLGRFSMEFVADQYNVELNGTISTVRGQDYKIETTNNGDEIIFIPLFHPAVALYDGSKRDTLKDDFEILTNYTS